MAQLEAALRGEAPAPAPAAKAAPAADGPPVGATEVTAPGQAAAEFAESAEQAPAPGDAEASPATSDESAASAPDLVAPADGADPAARTDAAEAEASPAPAAPPKPAPKPVIAVRGDDRPGNKKAEAVPAGRGGGKFGDRRDSRGAAAGRPGERAPRAGDRGAPAGAGRFGDRPPRSRTAVRAWATPPSARSAKRSNAPRCRCASSRRRRTAKRSRKCSAPGSSAMRRQLPSVQELGRAVTPAVRGQWSQALSAGPAGAADDAAEALLRLEMAAEVPTPAEQIDARRALQLKLLTKRGDPAPAQTWGQDAGKVLAAAHDATSARRLQNALKALLRK